MRRKHANLVPQYLAHIKVEAARVQAESRELQVSSHRHCCCCCCCCCCEQAGLKCLVQVFSNVAGKMGRHMGKLWDSQPFVHPASFATLMLEPELKQKVAHFCLAVLIGSRGLTLHVNDRSCAA